MKFKSFFSKMKFAKKLISIPEEEYKALINIFTGGDSAKTEKFETDLKIKNVLKNPRITELEKGKKYDILYKKRRKLAKNIDQDSSHQPLVEKIAEAKPLPTTGIVPAKVAERNVQIAQQQQQPHNVQQLEEFAEEHPDPETVKAAKKRESLEKYSKYHKIINVRMYDELLRNVEENRVKFGIHEDGRVISNLSKPAYSAVDGSDFKKILQVMTGQEKPDVIDSKIGRLLIHRLLANPGIRAMIPEAKMAQIGHGKRKKYMIDLKMKRNINAKTKGLVRQKYKPQLWTKLGV